MRLVQGAEDSVFVEGDDEAQDAVRLDVDSGVLKVRPSGSWKFWRSKQVPIVVTARDLRRLEIKGAADIVAAEPMRLKQLQVNISGAGSVRFDKLKAERLEFNVSGSGTGQFAGAVDELNVRISGRGVYLGENLASQTASLAVSGAGEVRIWTTKELTAHVSGVATIDFWGGAKVTRSNSGLTTWNDRGDKRALNWARRGRAQATRPRRSPSQTTVATTSSAPATCDGAIAWPRIAQASTSANTGSTFMIAALPTTPRRGSTVKRIVMPVP